MTTTRFDTEHADYKKLYNTAYGPTGSDYYEPDYEALGIYDRALQGLSRTQYEEES